MHWQMPGAPSVTRVTSTAALAEATSCSRKVSLGSSSPSARMGMLAPSKIATRRASHSSGEVCLRKPRHSRVAVWRPRLAWTDTDGDGPPLLGSGELSAGMRQTVCAAGNGSRFVGALAMGHPMPLNWYGD